MLFITNKASKYLTTRKGWSFSSKLDTSEFESKQLKCLLKFDEITSFIG